MESNTQQPDAAMGPELALAHGSGLPVGIGNYIAAPDGRPDRFQHEEGAYHFPCSACIHVKKGPPEYCEGCRHYAI